MSKNKFIKRKQDNIKSILIVLILLIGLGYALLQSNLSINGITNLSNPIWDVHWNNVQVSTGSVEADTPTIDTNKTTVSFNVTLTKPGDYYEFTVDAVNAGTIDAMIESISSKLNGTTITTLPAYLEYKVTYDDGVDLEVNHALMQNTTETYRVKVGYKKDISSNELPTTNQSIDLQFSVKYKQADNNAIPHLVTCEPGTYLPMGASQCSECQAGSFCPGGTYRYNTLEDSGTSKCAIGTRSSRGESSCRVCSKGYTTTSEGATGCEACTNYVGTSEWAEPILNSDNTVSNICVATACKTDLQGTNELQNGQCYYTGNVYSFIYQAKQKPNTLLSGNDYTTNYNPTSSVNDLTKYMYATADVVNNEIKATRICMVVNGNGMIMNGYPSGTYCFESDIESDAETVRQNYYNILKTIFGENNSVCRETTSGSYICRYSQNSPRSSLDVTISKDNSLELYYNDYIDGNKNPGCFLLSDGTAYCQKGCLSGETEVEVYDRKKKKRCRKKLRDVTPDDLILCWDFNTGKFVFVEPLWIKRVETMNRYYLLEFSDGSSLKVIGDHKVFDVDRGKFVNAGADNELEIGSHVFNSKGEVVELISWEEINEEIDAYNVITNYHMNLFANGILTSCVFSNIYQVEDMKYVQDDSERISVDDLTDIDEKYIKGLRLDEVPTNFRGNKKSTVAYIKNYIEKLLEKEKM